MTDPGRAALEQMFVWVETWMPGAAASSKLDAARAYMIDVDGQLANLRGAVERLHAEKSTRAREVLEQAADRIGVRFPAGRIHRDTVRDWLRSLAASCEVSR